MKKTTVKEKIIKESTIEKIEKEINEKTKLPNEVKEKIKKEAFTNFIIGIAIMLYFILIFLGSIESRKDVRIIDLNIFSFLFLGIAIFLFEIAYRKDDGKLAINGLELLTVAIFTLFLPYIIFELNTANKKYYLMVSAYIAVYYILKSIIISLKTKNKYMNSNISDIKEIVKKEKTKRRIKEDIEENEKLTIKEMKNANKQEIKEQEDDIKPKKRSRPKKENSNKEVIENVKVESTPKRRGRPKKSETTNIENKPKEETVPKKRGRPRKAVSK